MALKCAKTSHLPLQYKSRSKARPIPASRFLTFPAAFDQHEYLDTGCACGRKHSLHDRKEGRVLFLVVLVGVFIFIMLSEHTRSSSRLQGGAAVQPSRRRIQDHAPILARRVVRAIDGRDQRVGFGDAAERDEDIATARRERIGESCGSLGAGKGGDQAVCGGTVMLRQNAVLSERAEEKETNSG